MQILFSLLMLPFRLLIWALRRIAQKLRNKGTFYLVALLGFMSLDMIFPQMGGNLTTIGLVLGPALLMGLAFNIYRRLDGTMTHYIALSSYMAMAGIYGFFRAWSKAIDSTLPEVVGPVSRWLFGPLWNTGAGVLAALAGQGQAVPMPAWGPLPLSEHLLAMDPLLTGLSLVVLVWALHIFSYGARRYGGDSTRSPDEEQLARNRLTPLWRANWLLHGPWGNLMRVLKATFGPKRLPPSHLVIGFGAPGWLRPWAWPWLALCWVVSCVIPTEFTIFDPRRLLTADARNGAMLLGGSGAGKTLIQKLWLLYSTANKILVETQGNVFDKDLPLLRAAGRKLTILATDLGLATGSINVLAPFDPEDINFSDAVNRLAERIVPNRGEFATLERCARELVACVVANVIYGARVVDEVPRLDAVMSLLADPELVDEMSFWAEYGHPDFVEQCRISANRIADTEFRNSLAAIFSNELGFLAHPVKSAMVCGTGATCLDPADMLNDPQIDVTIQISQDTINVSGALLRLLLGALLEPRIRLSAAAAKRTPAPGVTVWIDELKAFAGPTPGSGAKVLDEIVDFHRQKGVRWVYAAQNIQQIDRGWGEGTYAKWANSAVLQIFGKVGADPDLDDHITDVAGKTLKEKLEKIPGAGGGWRAYQWTREAIDLLPRNALSRMGETKMVAFVRVEGVGLAKLVLWRPAFFRHPVLRRRHDAAVAAFGGAPAQTHVSTHAGLVARGRAALDALNAGAQNAPDAENDNFAVGDVPPEDPDQPNNIVNPEKENEHV